MRTVLSLILVALAWVPAATVGAADRSSVVLVAPEFPLSFTELQARSLFAFPAYTQMATPIEQLYEVDFVFENFRYRLTARYQDADGWQLTAFRARSVRTEDTPPIQGVPREQLFPDAGPTMWPTIPPMPTRGVEGDPPPPPPPPPPPEPGVIPPPANPGAFIGQAVQSGITGWQGWWNVSTTYTWHQSAGGAQDWYMTGFGATQCDGYQDC